VGGIGFVIDAGLLFVFTQIFYFNPFIWRLFSFLVASVVTWGLHRHFTFEFVASDPLPQWFRFALFNGMGGALNLLIYSLLLIYGIPPLDNPIGAVVVSSLIVLVFNFLVSKYLVFANA
jgi:putative flippase GtrA